MIRVGRGKSAITLDGPIGDGLEKQIKDLLGPVADKMQEEADKILEATLKEWPVGTGKQPRSRDAWDTVLTLIPGTFQIEVSILNPVRYVRYIKSTKIAQDPDATRIRSPLQALVAKPARATTRRLKVELPAILHATLNRMIKS